MDKRNNHEAKKKKNVDSIKNDTKWELRIYMSILPKQNLVFHFTIKF